MTWQDALDAWRMQMRSDYTRHSFGVPVRLFFEWSGEELAALSYETLDAWVFVLADRTNALPRLGNKITLGTMNKYLLALKLFLRYCIRKDWLQTLSEEDLKEVLKKWPGETHRQYEVLSREETSALLAAAQSMRDRCLLALGVYAGLRNFEICALQVGHIARDSEGAYVNVVQGKGKKTALVPIDEHLYMLLRTYAGDRAPEERMWPLSTVRLREIVKECARRAGILKRVTPHTLRHTFAYNLAKRNVPIAIICKLLRHSHINVTMIYIDHLTRGDIAQYAPVFPAL